MFLRNWGVNSTISNSTITTSCESQDGIHIEKSLLEEKYLLLDEVGVGSFGSVCLAKARYDLKQQTDFSGKRSGTLLNNSNLNEVSKDNRNNLVAIKTMLNKLSKLNDYLRIREIQFIFKIPSHPNLIQVFEVFVDKRQFKLNIVMEYMELNLYQMIKKRKDKHFCLPSLKSILFQILSGIRHIHSQDFFHRDLKPENILITPTKNYYNPNYIKNFNIDYNYVVKLADFGLARDITNISSYTSYVSTRWYRSPEILLRAGYYSKPLDIWAYGCVALEIIAFKPLFPGLNEIDQIWKILEFLGTPHSLHNYPDFEPPGGNWEVSKILANSLRLKFPFNEGISLDMIIKTPHLKPVIDVIKSCLKWDPNKRKTVDELFQMPFFSDFTKEFETNTSNINNKETSTINQALLLSGIKNNIEITPKQHIEMNSLKFNDENQEINENIYPRYNDDNNYNYKIHASSNKTEISSNIEDMAKEPFQFKSKNENHQSHFIHTPLKEQTFNIQQNQNLKNNNNYNNKVQFFPDNFEDDIFSEMKGGNENINNFDDIIEIENLDYYDNYINEIRYFENYENEPIQEENKENLQMDITNLLNSDNIDIPFHITTNTNNTKNQKSNFIDAQDIEDAINISLNNIKETIPRSFIHNNDTNETENNDISHSMISDFNSSIPHISLQTQ